MASLATAGGWSIVGAVNPRVVISGVLACLLGAGAAGAQSVRPGWGGTPYADAGGTGVTFRVWAPGAANASVAGTFNGWNTGAHPLILESATSGVWSADVAAARTNDNYKFVFSGSDWRTDPRGRIINAADNNNSVVVATNAFDWGGLEPGISNAHDLVIYEAHVGTFPGATGTFAAFSNRLDYLAELGMTGIELMPINEFPSATSWGYNPAYPFAVEYNYGTPDALRRLVRAGRQRGLSFLVDVVHNHWDKGADDGSTSLWKFDGTAPGPYFYGSDPYTWTWWGPRPDYGRSEVREYIHDTFRMWMDEYCISGFRWDAPNHILYTTNGVFIPDGLTMVTNALSLMAAEAAGILNIAEDTKEISGFDCHWDLAFAWEIKDVLVQGEDGNRDMAVVARNVAGAPGRIIFTESHDTTGDLNGGARLPTAIHGADPAGYYARKRSQLGMVLVMTSPGIPMIFQGQEVLETNQFSDTRPMDWARTNSQAGNRRLYQDLIRLRRNLDGVSAGLTGDTISAYQVDNVNKLVAYSRRNGGETGAAVVVVANFANTVRSNFPVQFPAAGTWYALFNSDSADYAADYGDVGSFEVAAAGDPPSGLVDIGRYSALIFSQTPRTGMVLREAVATDWPAGNHDGIPDPGETLREQLVLWNKSSVAATDVVATLTALTPGVAVEQGTAAYGLMAPDGWATNAADFAYRLDPGLACGTVLLFQLETAFNGQVLTSVFNRVVGQLVSQPPATNRFTVSAPMEIPDDMTVYSELAIAEPGGPVVTDLNVFLRINHTYDWDLTLALQHPDGSEVLLVNQRGGSGNNFGAGECGDGAVYTVLDQSAALAIASGRAPFTNSYKPEATLDTFTGKPLNGTWRLRMKDAFQLDPGTNLCWGIEAVYEQRNCECTVFSNRRPTASATNLWVAGPTNFTLGGADEDGQPLTFVIQAAPVHGVLILHSAATGDATYAPAHGYAGTDTATFAVADGIETSAPAAAVFTMPVPEDVNSNGLPDEWELRYWTNLVEATHGGDADTDGTPNWAEERANTNPRDSNSVLRLLPGDPAGLRWRSVGGTRYRVEWTDDLPAGGFQPVVRPPAEEVDPAAWGTMSTQTFTDPFLGGTSTNEEPIRIYRVRVLNE